MSNFENYVPLGDEWKKEMMKWTKPHLVDFLAKVARERNDLKNQLYGDGITVKFTAQELKQLAELLNEHMSAGVISDELNQVRVDIVTWLFLVE